jgi:ribonuclease BN (tRNA processing enzyme)
MVLEWTVLGAGTILPREGYGCAAHALRARPGGSVTLFDCGPGTVRALAASGIGVPDVERICISHFHPDHCLDLFALAFARRNKGLRDPARGGRGVPHLEIVGPRGIAALLERGERLFGDRGWTRFEDADVTEVDPASCDEPLVRGSLSLTWQATGHTPDAVAWRADGPGGSVAYTGDTGENPAVARLAQGVDLLVSECSFADELAVSHHLTPTSAGRLAALAGCKRLLLTHFYPGLDPLEARRVAQRQFAGEIELARDGSTHRVGV